MPLTRESRVFSATKALHLEHCGALPNHELLWLAVNGPEPGDEKVLYIVLPLVNIQLFR